MPKDQPILNFKDIEDPIIQRNFENLKLYFSTQNQLLDFKFLEVLFTQAESNRRIRHSLGLVPLDIVLTHLSGVGSVTFNYSEFTTEYIDLTASDACRVRFFFGVKNADASSTNGASEASQTFHPGG